MRAITNVFLKHPSFSIPVVLLILSDLINIVMNLHYLKVEKLHFKLKYHYDKVLAVKFTEITHQCDLLIYPSLSPMGKFRDCT